MSSGETVGLFCPTYLEPEMLHVHRHVNALRAFRPIVLTQKAKGVWSGVIPVVVPRSRLRELSRFAEQVAGRPWQLSRGEANAITNKLRVCRLLHIFFGDAAIHCLPLLDAYKGPVVISFHGADVSGAIAGNGYRRARERLFSRAELVACRSEDLVAKVAALGCPQGKLRVMRTILPDLPKGAPKAAPADGAWRLLQAGRLIPKKGPFTALQAFALFRQRFPLATFTLAGEGPLRGELEAEATRLGISAAVQMPGFLGQDALRKEFDAAHIYLHPSETVNEDREGVPNALLEAMANRLPPVATRHGGIPEVVEHGRSGLLCAEKDPVALAAALLELATNPQQYQTFSEGANKRVAEAFSPTRGIEAVEAIYREAMVCAC